MNIKNRRSAGASIKIFVYFATRVGPNDNEQRLKKRLVETPLKSALTF